MITLIVFIIAFILLIWNYLLQEQIKSFKKLREINDKLIKAQDDRYEFLGKINKWYQFRINLKDDFLTYLYEGKYKDFIDTEDFEAYAKMLSDINKEYYVIFPEKKEKDNVE